jgi:acyl CoA:acetate/3-ketoacid CoA transferase beta subunit
VLAAPHRKTGLGEFTIDKSGLTLTGLAPDVTIDEIKSKTEAEFKTAL